MDATATATADRPVLYSVKTLAELLGVQQDTVRKWEKRGRIPRARRLGPKVIRWTAEDVATILAGH